MSCNLQGILLDKISQPEKLENLIYTCISHALSFAIVFYLLEEQFWKLLVQSFMSNAILSRAAQLRRKLAQITAPQVK